MVGRVDEKSQNIDWPVYPPSDLEVWRGSSDHIYVPTGSDSTSFGRYKQGMAKQFTVPGCLQGYIWIMSTSKNKF